MTIATAETLPELSSPYPLTAEQIQAFGRDGHVTLPGVASPREVAPYREVFWEAVQRHNNQTTPISQRHTYGQAFIQIGNLWEKDERCRRFSFARRFARIAAGLMGVDAVRMYHDQALYKEPGGGFTPWHQDQFYWPLDTPHTITMWMPLVDITPEMGPMIFASGTHREGYLDALEISDVSEAVFEKRVKDRKYSLHSPGAMAAGDATFHAGWTLHRATPNTTERMREVMTVIWMADGSVICEPDNPGRKNDLATWLPGCRPGDVAASSKNPLLYSRHMAEQEF